MEDFISRVALWNHLVHFPCWMTSPQWVIQERIRSNRQGGNGSYGVSVIYNPSGRNVCVSGCVKWTLSWLYPWVGSNKLVSWWKMEAGVLFDPVKCYVSYHGVVWDSGMSLGGEWGEIDWNKLARSDLEACKCDSSHQRPRCRISA